MEKLKLFNMEIESDNKGSKWIQITDLGQTRIAIYFMTKDDELKLLEWLKEKYS